MELKKAKTVLREDKGKLWKDVEAELHRRNQKKIADFAKKGGKSGKTKKSASKTKSATKMKSATVSASSTPLSCDLDLDGEDDNLLSAPLVSTPGKKDENLKDTDSDSSTETELEVEEEIEEELDPEDYKKIISHRKTQGQMLVRVEYINGKKEWVHIAFVHVDAKELLGEYATKKQLTDDVWKAGKKEGDTIVAILEHRGGGKHQELKVLWNNGFLGWKPFAAVRAMDSVLVDKYVEVEGCTF